MAKKPAKPITKEEEKPHRPNHLPLTEKHLLFCRRYVLTGRNAAKASRESGFNPWYGSVQLLKNPLVREEIERYSKERAKKYKVDPDRIIEELVRVAFGTLGDFLTVREDGTPLVDCSEVGVEEMAAISDYSQEVYYEPGEGGVMNAVKRTKIKLHNKLEALAQLSKIFGVGGGTADSVEEKAARIRAAIKAMAEVDGGGNG